MSAWHKKNREYLRKYALRYSHSKHGKAIRKRYRSSKAGKKTAVRGRENNRAKMRAVKVTAKKQPCVDCGNRFPPECMDFHHTKGKKKFNLSYGVFQHSVADIMKEIKKCIVICANCHRIRTRKEGGKF